MVKKEEKEEKAEGFSKIKGDDGERKGLVSTV